MVMASGCKRAVQGRDLETKSWSPEPWFSCSSRKAKELMTALDFRPQGSLCPTLESQSECPETAPGRDETLDSEPQAQRLLASHSNILNHNSEPGPAHWDSSLSSSPPLNVCQPVPRSSVQLVQLKDPSCPFVTSDTSVPQSCAGKISQG